MSLFNPKCKLCNNFINVPLSKGLYSEQTQNNWVCGKCAIKLMEIKKSLQIQRMEV